MITTPLSRLAGLLNIDISSTNRADAQDAVCTEAEKNIRANQHRINQLHSRVDQTERENAELRAKLDMFQGKSNYPEIPEGSVFECAGGCNKKHQASDLKNTNVTGSMTGVCRECWGFHPDIMIWTELPEFVPNPDAIINEKPHAPE